MSNGTPPVSLAEVIGQLEALHRRFVKFSEDFPDSLCAVEADYGPDGKLGPDRAVVWPRNPAADWGGYGMSAGELLVEGGIIRPEAGESALRAFATLAVVSAGLKAIRFSVGIVPLGPSSGNGPPPPLTGKQTAAILAKPITNGMFHQSGAPASFASIAFALDSAIQKLRARQLDAERPLDPDGPAGLDGFRWRGKLRDGLTAKPFRLLDYLWNAKDWTADFTDLAVPVFRDHAKLTDAGQIGTHRTALNEFFSANGFPFKVQISGSKVALKKLPSA